MKFLKNLLQILTFFFVLFLVLIALWNIFDWCYYLIARYFFKVDFKNAKSGTYNYSVAVFLSDWFKELEHFRIYKKRSF